MLRGCFLRVLVFSLALSLSLLLPQSRRLRLGGTAVVSVQSLGGGGNEDLDVVTSVGLGEEGLVVVGVTSDGAEAAIAVGAVGGVVTAAAAVGIERCDGCELLAEAAAATVLGRALHAAAHASGLEHRELGLALVASTARV